MCFKSFLHILTKFQIKTFCCCPTNFIGGFNVNMLSIFPQSKELAHYMKHYNFECIFLYYTTNYNSQLDHIWINTIIIRSLQGYIETYWTNHKSIYIAFKLLDHFSIFHFLEYQSHVSIVINLLPCEYQGMAVMCFILYSRCTIVKPNMKDGVFMNKSSLHEKNHGRIQGTLNFSRICTLKF